MLNKLMKGIIFIVYLLLINQVFALPPLPSQFYGEVIINGVKAPVGTNISAYDPDNVVCGFIVIDEIGKYALSCKGDNLDTALDEGAKATDKITLYVNDIAVPTTAIWRSGSFNEGDISVNSTLTENLSPPGRKYFYLFANLILAILFLVLIIVIIKTRRGT